MKAPIRCLLSEQVFTSDTLSTWIGALLAVVSFFVFWGYYILL